MEEKNQTPPTSSSKAEFLILYSSSLVQEILVLASFFLVRVISWLPALPYLHTSFIGGSERDAGLYIWLMRSNIRDLFSLPWFNTTAFYPYTRTLAWSDNFILPSLVAWLPVAWGAPFALVYNLIILGANVLNGYFTYRLCFMLCGKVSPSFIAGSSFMMLTFFTEQLGHPQLQFAFWIPWAFFLLFKFIQKPNFWSGGGIGVLVFLSFLCSAYYSIFILLGMFGLVLSVLLLRPLQFKIRDGVFLVSGLAVGMLPLALFINPYLEVKGTFGERALYEAYYFAATGLSYLSSSPLNVLYGWTSKLSHAEAYLFPGLAVFYGALLAWMRLVEAKKLKKWSFVFMLVFIPLLIFSSGLLPGRIWSYFSSFLLWGGLICFGLFLWKHGKLESQLGFTIMTNRGLLGMFLFGAYLFFCLSLGPQTNAGEGEIVLSPFRVLYEILPGFDSLRAVSRVGVLVLFCLCTVFGLVLSYLQVKYRWSTRVFILIFLVSFLEHYHPKVPLQAEQKPGLVFDYMRNISSLKDVMVVLPMASEITDDRQVKSWGNFAELNVNYMQWAFPLNRPLVNGYSGQRSKLMKELPFDTANFPDRRSLHALGSIVGLRYVVYVSRYNSGFNLDQFSKKIENVSPQVRYLYGDNEGNHLLELDLIREVNNENFYLLAPSFPKGILHLELMTPALTEGQEIILKVFVEQYMPGAPYSEIKLKANGGWENFSIVLPQTGDTVRPIKVTLEGEEGRQVFVRRTGWED